MDATLPTPYYERDGITIYHGDCREILPLLPHRSIDLILTDPPYGETSLAWDRAIGEWQDLALPLLNSSGSMWCFGSLRYFLQSIADFSGWRHVQEIVWEKHNGSIFHADRFRRVHELLVHFIPRDVAWGDLYTDPQFTMDATAHTTRRKARPTHSGNIGAHSYQSVDGGPRLMRSVQQVRSCHGTAQHPTQKPEGIVRPALLYSCPVGGTVVDPFAGSCTMAVVAAQEGRKAICIESEEQYCATAVKRLQQSVMRFDIPS